MTRARGAWLAATTLAGLAVILTGGNATLAQLNRTAAVAVAQRQEYLAQTQQLVRVRQLVAQALAEAAQRDNDAPLRAFLAANGVTITPPATPPATPAASQPTSPPLSPPPSPDPAVSPAPATAAGAPGQSALDPAPAPNTARPPPARPNGRP